MISGTYDIQIASAAGGYEKNTLILDENRPVGTLSNFMGTPVILGKGILNSDTLVFDTVCGTMCGDFPFHIEITFNDTALSGIICLPLGKFPFTGQLRL